MLKSKKLKIAGIAAAAFSIFSATAHADTLNATNFGAYNEQGRHVGYNFNFATGYSDLESRGFFTFDLSSIAPNSVGDATLHLWNSTPADAPPGYLGYNSSDVSETINIYSVTTVSAGALSSFAFSNGAGDPAGIALFGDLGSGTLLGSLTVSKDASGVGSFADIVFNAAGVAEINANAGGVIAFGAALSSLSKTPGSSELLFSGWANNAGPYPGFDAAHAQLVTSPVPLPAAIWLLGSALAGLGTLRRKMAVAA